MGFCGEGKLFRESLLNIVEDLVFCDLSLGVFYGLLSWLFVVLIGFMLKNVFFESVLLEEFSVCGVGLDWMFCFFMRFLIMIVVVFVLRSGGFDRLRNDLDGLSWILCFCMRFWNYLFWGVVFNILRVVLRIVIFCFLLMMSDWKLLVIKDDWECDVFDGCLFIELELLIFLGNVWLLEFLLFCGVWFLVELL